MKWYFFIGLLLFLSSCNEYEYEKPLTSVCKATIDTNYIGFWQFVGYKTFNDFNLQVDSHYLMIVPFNKNEYVIVVHSTKENTNSLPLLLKAHLSLLKNLSLANVSVLDGTPGNSYVYYGVKVQNDSLYYWGFMKNKLPHTFRAKKFFTLHGEDTLYLSAIRKYKRVKVRFFN